MIIGLDVGGTHTDVVLLGKNGLIRDFKVRTAPEDLFQTVLTGLEKITEGINPAEIKRAVLSTTLTTNAIVQKKDQPVGMIVAGGPGIDPELFRTNADYYCVGGSVDHRGREITPVSREEIIPIVRKLKEKGIRTVGIVGKFSVRNPAHELKIREILTETSGDSYDRIFMGHRISGNLSFPRRIATTYLNALVFPLHKDFFKAVIQSLAQKGLKIPIHILKADGGTMNFASSVDFPGQTILSGPSASVMGATAFAPAKGECLVLDIGGTTTDMAILLDQVPLLAPQGIDIGNFRTLIRSLETRSIGIGGDSHVRVENGKIRIGPERTGPAMAYGGSVPTPTDAFFVLDLIQDGDRTAALEGIQSIASELGKTAEETASEIFDRACEIIFSQARSMMEAINRKPVYTIHELQEGLQVSPKTVLVLGGPAPYFARRMNEISDYDVRVIPRWKVANAIGAALARTTCEVSLFADTQQEIAAAPEEDFKESVNRSFSQEDAVQKAFALLRQKAVRIGADADDLETEVTESQQFNMVRGFYTTGRNIRVKVQIKPGLIKGYEKIAQGIAI
ncbi:MAG: hydantoinase/oxoprolinase family protein [Desulfococcaceae bacterium]|jgi:N-methylhydantoinase A/oxoprolinase/acetone carboxylase beta subunit|nr:hydantoinase/oxoprolinase family protein [Desulfococcaceae bacterium]